MTYLPVEYSAHDAAYRRLRARGAEGWSTGEEYESMWRLAAPAFAQRERSDPLHVLELGSGAGNFSIDLCRRGFRVKGVDISATAIEWAKELAQEAKVTACFAVDNVLELSTCSDQEFDVVVDGHCLHCIIGADRHQCLSSAFRVLKPGGTLVILTMCGDFRGDSLKKTFDPASGLIVNNGRPIRYIGKAEDIEAEVRRAGFAIDYCEVHARRTDDEQDDLVIFARKPSD